MGYGKERPCKKCSEVKLIQARGLCQSCFTAEKKAATLDNWPAAKTVAPKVRLLRPEDMGFDDAFMSHHDQPCDCAICDDIAFRKSLQKTRESIAWLVEQTGVNGVTWLAEDAPMGSFTADPDNVIRFARKEDAEAVIKIMGLSAFATEHIWYDVAEQP